MSIIEFASRMTDDRASTTSSRVGIPLSRFNRHGLIAGATGTGKSKTLQVLTENLSRKGVPVLLVDFKGDLSALADVVPVRRLSLTGKDGTDAMRVTVDSFGAVMLSRVFDASPVQAAVLDAALGYAADNDIPLDGLNDLIELLRFFNTDEGKDAFRDYGGASPQTVAVLLRDCLSLRRNNADFFGGPGFDVETLFATEKVADEEGVYTEQGVVTILDLSDMVTNMSVASAAMMWLLTEVYRVSPEVGDVDKPRLVAFFDEAHMLFRGHRNRALEETVLQTVAMIRSKGVGVFFATQSAGHLPEPILEQLNNRVQHRLNATTVSGMKNMRATAASMQPATCDVRAMLTNMGIAEALVSVLDAEGSRKVTVVAKVDRPDSLKD